MVFDAARGKIDHFKYQLTFIMSHLIPPITYRSLVISLLAYILPASGNSSEAPFFIDTADLIHKSAREIYNKSPDLEPGDLVSTLDPVWISCKPERQRTFVVPSKTQCPAQQKVHTPCVAKVDFPIRSTISTDIIVLSDGQCEINFSYDFTSSEQWENGYIQVNLNKGSGSGSVRGDCATIKAHVEIEEAVQIHKSALNRQISNSNIE